jgi:DNA-binding NarL/FixJ family response regulator
MSRARILLADDNASILERVASLLSAEFEIVAMVRDGQAAIDAIARLKPDLAVFDVSMPVMTGLEAAAALATIDQPPRVVFLTIHEDEEFVDAARRVGAAGYVLKRDIFRALIPAVADALSAQPHFLKPALGWPAPLR